MRASCGFPTRRHQYFRGLHDDEHSIRDGHPGRRMGRVSVHRAARADRDPGRGTHALCKLGGACDTSKHGYPIVQYDKAANRWVMSQFAAPGGTAGYWQCVAVSQTSDATGAWKLYAFPAPNFNDYPKMGVWSDGYYVTF